MRLWIASLLELAISQRKMATCMRIAAETFDFDFKRAPSRGAIQQILREFGVLALAEIGATLKTWIEIVFGARAAGLTVMAKALQLWHVRADTLQPSLAPLHLYRAKRSPVHLSIYSLTLRPTSSFTFTVSQYRSLNS